MPQRLQRSRKKGWRMPADAVYVGRPTRWGNPFVIGRDGTAERCVALYKDLMGGRLCTGCDVTVAEQQQVLAHAMANLERLRGKNLVCWCRGDHPCHADVLLERANR